MGFFYSTGLDGEAASQPMALLHYMFAALGGNTYAQMALGYRYLYGINVENKCEQALHFYRKVASKVVDHVPVTGKPCGVCTYPANLWLLGHHCTVCGIFQVDLQCKRFGCTKSGRIRASIRISMMIWSSIMHSLLIKETSRRRYKDGI